jgi:hypothetical protein
MYFPVLKGNLERYVKDKSCSAEKPVNVHLGRTAVMPS